MNEFFNAELLSYRGRDVTARDFTKIEGRRATRSTCLSSPVLMPLLGVFVLVSLPSTQALAEEGSTTLSGRQANTTAVIDSTEPCAVVIDRANPGRPAPFVTKSSGCADGNGGVAIGHRATASQAGAVALGSNSNAGTLGIAIGAETKAAGPSAIAIGPAALANAGGVGVGRQSAAVGDYSLAFGNVSYAQGKAAIALGHSAYASGYRSIAIGGADTDKAGVKYDANSQTQASGLLAIAFGAGARASGNNSLALGGAAIATGDNSVALGASANANAANSVAMGNGAQTTTAASAATAGAGTVTNATVGSTKFVEFAGASPTGVISVGTVGFERRIQNVASGQVSAASTDAINGSQLYATDQVLDQVSTIAKTGWNLSAQGSSGSNIAPGATVNLKNNDGNVIVSKAATSNDVGFDLAKNLKMDSVTTGNSKLSTTGLAITGGPSMTAGGIDGGGKQIHNITNGNAPTDAANVGQVKALGDTGLNFTGNEGAAGKVQRKLGETLTIDGGASTAGSYTGNNLKTVNDPKTGAIHLRMAESPKFGQVTVNDGGSGRISGVAPGSGDTDAVNKRQLDDVKTNAGAGWNVSAQGKNSGKIAPGATVDLKNTDENLVVTKAAASNDVSFDLAKNLKVDSVTTGNSKLSTTGLVITGGPSMTAGGIDGGGNQIHNITNGNAPTDAANVGQVKALGDAGLSFTGNEATAGKVQRKLGETLTIGGEATTVGGYAGNNLKTVTDPKTGAIRLQMAEAPKFGNITVNDSRSGRISGVSAGVGSTDAVNKQQLDAVGASASAGWNISAQGTHASKVASGQTVDLKNGDGNILVSKAEGSNTVDFNLAKELKIDSVAMGDTRLDARGLTIRNGPSVTAAGIDGGGKKIGNVSAGTEDSDVVNLSQLKTVSSSVAQTNERAIKYKWNDTNGNGKVDPGEIDFSTATLVGTTSIDGGVSGGTKITNLSQGEVSAKSTDAINGAQLHAIAGPNDANYIISNGRGVRYARINDAGSGPGDAHAKGLGSTALGFEATAESVNATALGKDAYASHENSVALGAGSATTAGPQKNYEGAFTHGSNSTGQVHVGNRTIGGTADGVAADDAVNVRQLKNGVNHAISESNRYTDSRVSAISNTVESVDKRTTVIEGTVTQITKGGAGLFQVSQDNTSAPAATGTNSAAAGAGATASGKSSAAIGNGSLASGERASAFGNGAKASAEGSVAIGTGSVADRANTVSIGAAGQERKIANVAAGSVDTDAVNVSQLKDISNGGVQYDKNADGTVNHRSVTLNQGHKEATTIRNVAGGVAPTDAANVAQLSDGLSKTLTQANVYADRQFQEIKGDLSDMNHDIRGGVASAMAMAGLPQAYLPGKSMAAIAASSYRGESGIAIGVSTITESGRYVYKLQSSGNTSGDWGVTMGAGIQW